jgi:hypothetical protein
MTTVLKVVFAYKCEQFHELQDSGFEEGQFCPQLKPEGTMITIYGF